MIEVSTLFTCSFLTRQYLLPQLYAITQKGHLSVIEEEFEKNIPSLMSYRYIPLKEFEFSSSNNFCRHDLFFNKRKSLVQ